MYNIVMQRFLNCGPRPHGVDVVLLLLDYYILLVYNNMI